MFRSRKRERENVLTALAATTSNAMDDAILARRRRATNVALVDACQRPCGRVAQNGIHIVQQPPQRRHCSLVASVSEKEGRVPNKSAPLGAQKRGSVKA